MKRSVLTVIALVAASFGTAASPAHAEWALAFGQDGPKHWAFGSAWNQPSMGDARRKARSNCDSHGPNCKVVLDGTGGCVALAVGTEDNAWHARRNRSRHEAAQSALDECVKSSSGDCEVRETFCEEQSE